MSISVYYDGDFSSGVEAIQTGSYIAEANPALSTNLPNGMIMNLSQMHFHLTGAYYETQSTNGGLIQIYADIYNAEDVRIAQSGYKKLSFSKVTASPTYQATYLCDVTLNPSDYTYYAGYDDDPVPAKIYIRLWYERKSGGNTWVYDIQTDAITITGYPYVFPSMSAFTMNRALNDVNMTISNQGKYGRYDITSNLAAILASDEPQFIKDNTALTLSFTRNGSTISHAAASGGTGLLQSSGAALLLGNEETFTVTAALTDGINTVSMSALLSANFAIFNANAAKTGISFGKYATQSGFDCNMDAEFRGSTVFDADATNDSIHHTFNSIPFIVPNMMECLWRKASPTASMGGNSTFTLSRELTAGEPVLLVYRMWEATNAFAKIQTILGWAGHIVTIYCLATSTTNRNGRRDITIGPYGSYDASTVYFGNCEYNGSTNNNYCVLLAVYAFKREWLNHDDALEEYETANNL